MSKRFTINGLKWRYVRERLRSDRHGDCDPPTARNRAMRVDERISGQRELIITIHEARHAENFDMYDEGYVKKRAEELGKMLWALGYRKVAE